MSVGLGLYDMLRGGENLGERWGLPAGVQLFARSVRGGQSYLVTVGTAADHVSKILEPPPKLAGERDLLDWIENELADLVREYRQPLRHLHFNALPDLQAALEAGAVTWPP